MSISFACNNCGKQYTVDEKLSGKKAKCKSCSASMNIPEAAAMAQPVAAQPVAAHSFNDFGLDGPLESQDDLFDCPTQVTTDCPLGNHVGEESGLTHAAATEEENGDVGVSHGYSSNHALAGFETEQRKLQKAAADRQELGGGKKKGKKGLIIALCSVATIALIGGIGGLVFWLTSGPGN